MDTYEYTCGRSSSQCECALRGFQKRGYNRVKIASWL